MASATSNAILIPEDAPVLDDDDRKRLLDVLCCFYDFTNCKPQSRGELKDAWWCAVKKQEETRKAFWTYMDYDEKYEDATSMRDSDSEA